MKGSSKMHDYQIVLTAWQWKYHFYGVNALLLHTCINCISITIVIIIIIRSNVIVPSHDTSPVQCMTSSSNCWRRGRRICSFYNPPPLLYYLRLQLQHPWDLYEVDVMWQWQKQHFCPESFTTSAAAAAAVGVVGRSIDWFEYHGCGGATCDEINASRRRRTTLNF